MSHNPHRSVSYQPTLKQQFSQIKKMNELCKDCIKMFSNKCLKKHIENVHVVHDVKCTECYLWFQNKRQMCNHKKVHNDKIFKCEDSYN